MPMIDCVNWPWYVRLACWAAHRKAVDVSAKYHPANKAVRSIECPDCGRVYWRHLTAGEQEKAMPSAEPRHPAGQAPWSKIECA